MTTRQPTSPEVSADRYETEDRSLFLFLTSRGIRHISHKKSGGKVKFVFNRGEVKELLSEFTTSQTLMVDYRMVMQNEALFNVIVHEDF